MSTTPQQNGSAPKPKAPAGKKEVKVLMLHGKYDLESNRSSIENIPEAIGLCINAVSFKMTYIEFLNMREKSMNISLLTRPNRLHTVRPSLPRKDTRSRKDPDQVTGSHLHPPGVLLPDGAQPP
jgi:hypothetical protein